MAVDDQSRQSQLQDDRGRLIRLLGVEVDITERKLYEEALFREKESAQITLTIDWRWRNYDRRRMQRRIHQPGGRRTHRLES